MGDVCDLCEEAGCAWAYTVREATTVLEDMDVSIVTDMSSEWRVCEPCHALAEAGDREGLARRTVDLLFRRHGLSESVREEAMRLQRSQHAPFWDRDGEVCRRPTITS